ncbi:fatty acid desaturase [Myxococcota bacterium]|nr:fatty acid desaturase [Myxococcota bacterium]
MADTPPAQLVSHADYLRALRPHLPPEAFEPAPSRLLVLLVHAVIILGGARLAAETSSVVAHVAIALVIGHSMACTTFIGHDITHGAVVRNRLVRWVSEAFAWSFIFMPASVWRKMHNVHHSHVQTPRDCDRHLFEHERSGFSEVFKYFYPNASNPMWNPLVHLHFLTYTFGNTALAFTYGLAKERPDSPLFQPYKPRELAMIVAELGVVVAVHTAIFFLVGGDLVTFLVVDGVANFVGSGILMGYIFTNHAANPITSSVDPLVSTTSLRLPQWIATLHSNFSFHTEHHLFPAMDSRWYPEVSKLLVEKFPDRYIQIPFPLAWKRIYDQPVYSKPPQPET